MTEVSSSSAYWSMVTLPSGSVIVVVPPAGRSGRRSSSRWSCRQRVRLGDDLVARVVGVGGDRAAGVGHGEQQVVRVVAEGPGRPRGSVALVRFPFAS